MGDRESHEDLRAGALGLGEDLTIVRCVGLKRLKAALLAFYEL